MIPIPGYTAYLATPEGKVYTTKLRKGLMKPTADRNGYLRLSMIGDNGRRKGVYLHQIVAMTFLDNPDNKPFVNHLDHDKSNNSVKNLVWCTHLENIRHDWKMGKRRALFGEESGNSKITSEVAKSIRDLHKKGSKQAELATMFGISQPTVSQVIRGLTWRVLS